MAHGRASGSHHSTGADVEKRPWLSQWRPWRQRRQRRWSSSWDVSAPAAESQMSGGMSVSAMYSQWRVPGLITGPFNGLTILNWAEIFGRFSFISGWAELGEFR